VALNKGILAYWTNEIQKLSSAVQKRRTSLDFWFLWFLYSKRLWWPTNFLKNAPRLEQYLKSYPILVK